MDDNVVASVVGFSIGVGLSSMVYMGVFIRSLKKLHFDNIEAARLLLAFQSTGVQDVEEQNMHAVLKRIDELEAKQ
jgi:hypothetical protein